MRTDGGKLLSSLIASVSAYGGNILHEQLHSLISRWPFQEHGSLEVAPCPFRRKVRVATHAAVIRIQDQSGKRRASD
jgi:hypothetical protein